jgi:hypothetical protein
VSSFNRAITLLHFSQEGTLMLTIGDHSIQMESQLELIPSARMVDVLVYF